MAQTVLRQVLILAVMMMLGFLLGKRGKVDRKGADILSMLLLDVFFPCNILAAASGDFGDMPFSQVIKIALAYMSCFILFTLLAKPIAKLLRLNEDDSLVFTRSVGPIPTTALSASRSARLFSARRERYWARFPCPAPHSTCSFSLCRASGAKKIIISSSSSRACLRR